MLYRWGLPFWSSAAALTVGRRLFELAVLPLTIIDELLPLGPVLFTTSSRGGLTSITSRYRAVVLERIDKGGSVSGSFHAELRVRRR